MRCCLFFGNSNSIKYMSMLKKIAASISILSLLITLVPTSKNARAVPAQRVAFEGTSSVVTEGDLVFVTLQPSNEIGASKYIDVYYTISGTANSSDYTFNDGLGVFRIRDNDRSFPLYSIDEGGGIEAANETVIITLQAAIDSDNNSVSLDQNNKVYTHTIKNNNGLTRLSFLYNTATVDENAGSAMFRVYLSRPAVGNVGFQWMFADSFSTATNQQTMLNGHGFPADVTLPASVWQNATIPAGQSFIDIPLGLQDDNLFEENETAVLVIGGQLSNAVLGQEISQTYTIIDNDLPEVSFQSAASSGQESVANVTLTVNLSKALREDVEVAFAVDQVHSTAQWGGVDWTQMPPLKILAGATSANTSITIVNDNQQEGNENAVVSIVSAIPAVGEPLEIGANNVFTYTIIDNDAPANPPGGGTGTPTPPTVPPGVCPTLSPGDMVKVNGKPAIYVVNRFNKIMYFPSGDEFKSWNENDSYGGYVTVTQDCFDNGLSTPVAPPAGVNFRPGSYVIQKENTAQLYAVLANNTIAKITDTDAKALYGTNYKVMTIKFIFWSNYVNTGADISGKVHSGMLVRKDNKIWYVDGNSLREVTAAGMSANRFKSAFIHTVPASYVAGFAVGAPIDGSVLELANRTQL